MTEKRPLMTGQVKSVMTPRPVSSKNSILFRMNFNPSCPPNKQEVGLDLRSWFRFEHDSFGLSNL